MSEPDFTPPPPYRSKRVRPKTYVFAFYMTVGVALIPLAAVISVFWLRHRVQIDTHSPALLRKEAELKAAIPSTGVTSPPVATPEPPPPSGLKPTLGPARLTVPVDPVQKVFDLDQQAYGYMQQGEYDLARVTLLQAENVNASDPRTLSYQGELAEAENDWKRAASYWQRLVSLGSAAGTLGTNAPQRLQAAKARAAAPPPVPALPSAQAPTQVAAAPAATPPLPTPARTNAPAPETPAPSTAAVNPATILKAAPIEKSLGDGADFILRVPILCAPGVVVDPGKVGIKFFFYDDSKSGPIPTNARLDVAFENLRPNWNGGRTEVLRAYYQKTSGPDVRFYGYLFRLYYNGVLQEERADPPSLLQLYPATP